MQSLIAVLLFLAAVTSANAVPFTFSYDIPAPKLAANENIDGFALQVQLLSSVAGKNGNPADITLGMIARPNPFLPAGKMPVPNTIDGVDPKTGQNPQFFYKPGSFAIEDRGSNMSTNDKFPGLPAGTTTRIDSVGLDWEVLNAPVKFPAGNKLKFGATVNMDRLYYTTQVPPATRAAYRDTMSLQAATWILDNTNRLSASIPSHTVQMGMNASDPNDPTNQIIQGLSFAYTNSASTIVEISDLAFFTSITEPSLDDLSGSGATSLFGGIVTIDGLIQSLQSFYDVPAGSTIQFLFPETNDRFFIAEGLVSAGGVPQFGFGFEDQLSVPEPAVWMLLVPGIFGLIRMRTASTGGASDHFTI